MRIIDMPEFQDKQSVLSFDANTPLEDAIVKMASKNFGACVVTQKNKIVGIFTERDLLRRVAAQGVDIKASKLKDVMTSDVHTAKVDDKIADSMRRMSQGRYRHLPIVDDNDKLIGMLSQGDFVALTMTDIAKRLTVTAKAGVGDGSIKPFTMVVSIVLYTLGLLFFISAASHWFGR